MAVLTKSELTKKKSVKVKEEKIQQEASLVKPKEANPVEINKYSFLLFHPENPADNFRNFEKEIEIKGGKYIVKCVNGQVKTTSEILANKLIADGYLLISQEEITNETK